MTATPVFHAVPTALDFPRYEGQILDFWKDREIFAKSLTARGPDAPHFVFYEGPPTANGVPHNGHVLTRVMKDLFPRYKSMCGHRVLRKAGWDTHGLPVEVEVEKELRIHGKAAIEQYGVEPFVARCIESVFRYTGEWERLTERIAFWVSLEEAYVTYHRSYVESVWWALSKLFEKGLLYQGHKVVWWWAQGGTALSSAEVGLGYKSVDDPAIFVVFPLRERPIRGLVAWTTTPWTLPSNVYAAVRSDCDYVVVTLGEPLPGAKAPKEPQLAVSEFIVAAALRPELEKKLGRTLNVLETLKGAELVGQRYVPPFDLYASGPVSQGAGELLADARVALKDGGDDALFWRVIAEDFVTLDTGTGIVHIAPAFGEDDNRAHQKQLRRYALGSEVELLCAVNPDGSFKPEIGSKFAGRWVKETDRELIAELAERQLLLLEELYRHDYPYCWRSDKDPLIQLARPAWYIRTTEKIAEVIENNQAISWLPEHIKTGRFGDFLANNVDWALSRERFWGTPLNVWVCSADPEHKHAPASVNEILAANPRAFDHFDAAKAADPSLNEHLRVHKPWIDHVTLPCPHCGASMKRVTEVIDCWFDSGCMPFAQWGFPHLPGSKEQFDDAFPASFISEAIDQTRGWFYSLLMVSSLVFDEKTQQDLGLKRVRSFPHPYESCIVLGHVCDREGKKESKSKGNYTPPEIILDRVKMDFGVVVDTSSAKPAVNASLLRPGVALIAPEDLDGMDLEDGARVNVYRPDAPETVVACELRAVKHLPRRVVLLAPSDRETLGVVETKNGLKTMPVEVPRLAVLERVTVEDPHTPAPGADAFRWFFYASSPPWSNTRHSLKNVRTLQKDFLVKLRNVYSFFTIYANIDAWSPANPAQAGRPLAERGLLDRWILSEVELAAGEVRRALDAFSAYEAAQRLVELVEGLSNWYVRRSRERFWAPGLEADKRDAYATLWEVLVGLSRLMAPFTPFFAEEMYQNLMVQSGVVGARESVHLEDYPTCDAQRIDSALALEMRAVREIVSLGLSVRAAQRLKVRQPLERLDVVFNQAELLAAVQPHLALIAEELNVHEVRPMLKEHEQGAIGFRIKANFRTLGPRLGKGVQAAKAAFAVADGSALYVELCARGRMTVEIEGQPLEFTPDEVEVAVEAKPGFAAETGRVGVVVLHTTLTEALIDEGLLREVTSRIQAARKDLKLDFAARIAVQLDGSERVVQVARQGSDVIARECLVSSLTFGPNDAATEFTLGSETLRLHVSPA